ncbi:MAG: hypothetical protein KDC44_25280 [Phaeodactylibacter sp.]|nr:hypothetical protein [Phaeodactylibacter sp.]
MPKSLLPYILFFLLIFALTQTPLLIQYSSAPGWLGLPTWLWYFMGFHLLLVVGLYFLSRSEASKH